MEPLGLCPTCNKQVPISDFYPNGTYASGKKRLRTSCKGCEKKRVKKYRKSNPFMYHTIKCNKCEEEFSVRVSKPVGLLAIICPTCLASQKQAKQKEKEHYVSSN